MPRGYSDERVAAPQAGCRVDIPTSGVAAPPRGAAWIFRRAGRSRAAPRAVGLGHSEFDLVREARAFRGERVDLAREAVVLGVVAADLPPFTRQFVGGEARQLLRRRRVERRRVLLDARDDAGLLLEGTCGGAPVSTAATLVSSDTSASRPRRSLPEPTLSVDFSSRAHGPRPLVAPSYYPRGSRGAAATRLL